MFIVGEAVTGERFLGGWLKRLIAGEIYKALIRDDETLMPHQRREV